MYQFIRAKTLIFHDDTAFNFAPIGTNRIFILPNGESYLITDIIYGFIKPSVAALSATIIGSTPPKVLSTTTKKKSKKTTATDNDGDT